MDEVEKVVDKFGRVLLPIAAEATNSRAESALEIVGSCAGVTATPHLAD